MSAGASDASALWDLPGQAQATQALRSAAEAEQIGHAWAFVGPPGVGQQQAARALAAALNCPVAAGGCGRCAVCDRCLRGAHPAYWEFVPSGAAHRVADVREQWLPIATRSAAEGDAKVLRIVEADRMNEAAANAFLKGLEEPPARTVWILEIADPEELPDTILSRCRAVRFSPWSRAALRDEAARLGIPAQDGELAARVAQGSPAVLGRLADADGMADLRRHRMLAHRLRAEGPGVALLAAREVDEEVRRRTAARKAAGRAELDELDALYGDSVPRGVARQVEERSAREERETRAGVATAVIDDLRSWYRDALVLSRGGDLDDILHHDAEPQLRADADALGPARLLLAGDLLQRARDDLELNLQQGLALEALFIELATMSMGASGAGVALAVGRRRS